MKNNIKILILLSFINLILCSEQTNILESKYIGGWPSSTMQEVKGSDMIFNCPGDIGCECYKDDECSNNNCGKLPKGKYCMAKDGDYFPDFVSLDQYGQEVRLYDFSNQGKYILIEMGTTWCPPCHMLANWLSFNDQEIINKNFWNTDYQLIHDLVQSGDIYYITILYENDYRENVKLDDIQLWHSMYPHDKMPIIGDFDKFLHTWIKPTGLPAVMLLNEDMEIVTFSSRGMNIAFDSLIDIYNSKDGLKMKKN